MRIDDLNEAPMGILNRMAQKVVSKVPGSVGAKAQGRLETGQVANQWKKDYMKYLGRIGQKADTENLKAFLKSLGMTDQDTNAIVGESALIERALTGAEIDKIILKAAQKGGGEAMTGKSSGDAAGSDAAPSAQPETPSAAPDSSAPASKPSLAQRAGQAVKGLAGKAASAIGQKLSPGAATAQAGQRIEPTVKGVAAPQQPAAQPQATAGAAPAKAAGSSIDTYINNWAKNINAAASSQEKVALAKEVINFLKDRKGSPEGQRGAAMAKAVLKRSNDPKVQQMVKSGAFALERKMYAVVNKLLEAVGLTWRDLGYRIAVTESTSEFVVIVER